MTTLTARQYRRRALESEAASMRHVLRFAESGMTRQRSIDAAGADYSRVVARARVCIDAAEGELAELDREGRGA